MVPGDRRGWSAASRTPALILPSLACSDPLAFRIDSLHSSFATVALEIEREDAVQARGASKNFGMAQRAYCVVVTRAPMVLHRQARKLVVLGVTFVVLSPVNQVNDVVDLVTGDRLQDLQIIVLLKISRKPAQQGIKGTLDPVHVLKLAGACSRAA